MHRFPFARSGLVSIWAFVVVVAFVISRSSASAASRENLHLSWTNNMLSISAPWLPGGSIETLYLEAFCRSGSTHRDWHQTTIPHRTVLVKADADGRRLQLRTTVEPSVVVEHELRASRDAVEFKLVARNEGAEFVDVQWFQPCMRVGRFTGLQQSNYVERSFIFTANGLTLLNKARHTEEAIYKGGQVYVPAGINTNDVNPRPLSPDVPVNNLIGCISADNRWILATAWDQPQELFQGVIVCLHADPRIGGLKPGERRSLMGRVYVVPNDSAALLKRYRSDFPRVATRMNR